MPTRAKAILILVVAAGALFLLGRAHAQRDQELRAAIRAEEEAAVERMSLVLEAAFRQMYQSARTLALLPGIRGAPGGNLPRDHEKKTGHKYDAARFPDDARLTVQQLYNNLATNVAISEVYGIVDGFAPAQGETPFFMFDELILQEAKSGEGGGDAHEAADPDEPEELEEEEYAHFLGCLAELRAAHPRFDFATLDAIPCLISPVVRTCDNTQYRSRSKGDSRDAAGITLSVPFYSPDGAFRGIISVIVRLNVLEALLVERPFLPISPEEQAEAARAGWSLPEEPSRFVLRRETPALLVSDRRASAEASRGAPALTHTLAIPGTQRWHLDLAADPARFADRSREVFAQTALQGAVVLLVAFGLLIALAQAQKNRRDLRSLAAHMTRLARGEATTTLDLRGGREVRELATSFGELMAGLPAQLRLADRIADGDLAEDGANAIRRDAFGVAILSIHSHLRALLSASQGASGAVQEGARQIAAASQGLSDSAMRQAASLEEIGASLTAVRHRADEAAQGAGTAHEIGEKARLAADAAGGEVAAMTQAIEELSRAGTDILRVARLIDDIAFQTNLLALNAAVEAARAGRHGKGFAVVADEVRSLAGRSAKAAREAGERIEATVEQVKRAQASAARVDASLREIAEASTRAATLGGQMSDLSHEQARAVAEIETALTQIESAGQSTAATAEQASAAAQTLRAEAEGLAGQIAQFRL